MDREEAINIAYSMGAHPYSVLGMADALMQGYEMGKAERKHTDIEIAWDFFKHDVRINYIHTFGKEPDNGVMEKYKELFIERMEE